MTPLIACNTLSSLHDGAMNECEERVVSLLDYLKKEELWHRCAEMEELPTGESDVTVETAEELLSADLEGSGASRAFFGRN